ncbi:4Fe-4S binding protein [Sedimentibacter hydroxybenzoicus DSM 7310]|uniref:4Fe-4S binding protein n=1 Tax=Sedimentibacter hydroxybenzoicus DSM 7310 TaxID=1123245 RepID=A0A974GW67_SEDHY|nr:4Fe-4S binding protein [Sedimentibacter hydroxybenzoicus]NYB74154.1 4Fe-4S binding protein [Sedimentibacter hydroxybenzoicus DSM 7310]
MTLRFENETCSGCKACQLVCTLHNFKEINPSKAMLNVHGRFPAPGKYHVDVCNQCGECAEACPAEAIKFKDGTYIIDYDICIECLICVDACPTNVMKVNKEDNTPYKCNNCRQCVEICPRDALIFEQKGA